MNTDEQVLSIDLHSSGNQLHYGNNGETKALSPLKQTHFFRTKRKQRVGENSTDTNGHSEHEVSSLLNKFKGRSSSPPPPPSSSEFTTESDENDECHSSTEDEYITAQHQPRPSLPIICPGYQRKKSHSVKLTNIAQTDSCPKKVVRFADDFGLDLNQIRIITIDEIPCVPIAAFKHLQITNKEPSTTSSPDERMKVIYYMEPQFDNPVHSLGFNDRVGRQKVALEQANAIDNRIYGTVKLISCSLHKRVQIRLTTNDWRSFRDYDATYMTNSYDGTCDRFSFTLEIDRQRIADGNNVQFCICFKSFGGLEYWDNNYQENYRFNCLTRTIPDCSLQTAS